MSRRESRLLGAIRRGSSIARTLTVLQARRTRTVGWSPVGRSVSGGRLGTRARRTSHRARRLSHSKTPTLSDPFGGRSSRYVKGAGRVKGGGRWVWGGVCGVRFDRPVPMWALVVTALDVCGGRFIAAAHSLRGHDGLSWPAATWSSLRVLSVCVGLDLAHGLWGQATVTGSRFAVSTAARTW